MAFDANAAQALTLALTNLNAMLVGGGRENKSVNYPIFSERGRVGKVLGPELKDLVLRLSP